MNYITESLEISAQGVPKPQLKANTRNNKDLEPTQAQKKKKECCSVTKIFPSKVNDSTTMNGMRKQN